MLVPHHAAEDVRVCIVGPRYYLCSLTRSAPSLYPTTQFEDVCGVEKMTVDRDEFVSGGSVGGGLP